MAEMETFYKNKLKQERSALKDKVEELKSCIERSALKDKVEELTSCNERLQKETAQSSSYRQCNEYKQSLTDMERKLAAERSALKDKDEELKSVKQSIAEMETFYKNKLKQERSALKDKVDELKSCIESLTDLERKLATERSVLKDKDEELKSVKQSITEMEKIYEDKLKEERLAADVGVSINARDTESLNNPVSKSRLTEMYRKVRLLQWPKIKDYLKSNKMNPEITKALIQKMFSDATDEMGKKKQQIEEVVGLIESSSGLTPQKVKQYRQLAIQNLQMSLYRSNKEAVLKTPLVEYAAQCSVDVMEKLRLLATECCWLGCLMALSNPPLQPDWQNHITGMDVWDIFPQDVKIFFPM